MKLDKRIQITIIETALESIMGFMDTKNVKITKQDKEFLYNIVFKSVLEAFDFGKDYKESGIDVDKGYL